MATTARSRSVSITVPVPPPPSPHCYEYDSPSRKSSTLVTAVNLEELLRLLCSKTDTAPVLQARSTAQTPAASPSLSVSAVLDGEDFSDIEMTDAVTQTIVHYVGPDVLTLRGNGGEAGRDQMRETPRSDPGSGLTHRPGLTDAGDESLQRYKESLGLGGGKDLSDPSDPRVAIIKKLSLETAGRDPVTIDLTVPGTEHTLKDHPFTIKEGAKFTMVATFKVQHEVLSGLRHVLLVKRKGVRVSKDSEMIGSYAPNTDKQPLYTKRFQEDEAPTGMLARGHYNAISSFVDDDKKTHLTFEWSFDIKKDW